MNCQIISDKEQNRILKLEGELTVVNSAEVKGYLKKLMKDEGELVIDHSSAESFDFSYVQLLAAFQYECEHKGRQLSFCGETPHELIDAVCNSGFTNEFDFS